MGGAAKTSERTHVSPASDDKTVYDFLPWAPHLFFPVEKYKTGRKKPFPKSGAKSIRKAVSRWVMGKDNLTLLGDSGRLTGKAELEWVTQKGKRES